MNESNEEYESRSTAIRICSHERNEVNEQSQRCREWTADDVLQAIAYAQAIPFDSIDQDELARCRPAAALMAAVTDAAAIARFADWFDAEHPHLNRFDARDLRRLWNDFRLHQIREAHRRAA